MRHIYKYLLVIIALVPFSMKGQNDLNLFQIVQNDTLFISIVYTHSGAVTDTLGSSNLRINFDTTNLDASGAVISFRGNYDIANHAGYQAMNLAPNPIVDTFFTLNIFNANTIGYRPLGTEVIAIIAIPVKNACGTSGVEWRTIPKGTFPFSTVNHYNGTSLGTVNYTGDDVNFPLCVLTANAGAVFDTICFNDSDTLFATLAGLSKYKFYSDLDGAIDSSTTNNFIATTSLSVGTHHIWVEMFDSTCSSGGVCIDSTLDSVTVVVHALPGAIIDPATNDSICAPIINESYSIVGSGVLGSIYTWSIFNGNGSFNGGSIGDGIGIDWNTTGLDTVEVHEVDSNGCEIRDTLPVFIFQNPIPNLGNDTIGCGISIVLDANISSASSYQWYSLPGPTLLAGEVNKSFTATSTGDYMVEVDSTGNGTNSCHQYDTIKVTIFVLNDKTITPTDVVLCDSGTASFTVNSVDDNVHYFLRTEVDSSIVAGPVSGAAGTNINLTTGVLTSNDTFNVYAISGGSGNLDFDGIDDRLTQQTLFFGTDYTLESWVRVENGFAGHTYLINGVNAGGTNDHMVLGAAGGKVRFLHRIPAGNGGGTSILSTTDINDGEWHHIAGVKEGVNLYLYVDGILEATAIDVTDYNRNVDVNFGFHNSGARDFFGGVDNLRIWNGSRSQAEIQAGMTDCIITDIGLILNYDFEEGSGSPTVTDISGNGHHGALINMDILNDWENDGPAGCGTCELEMTQLVSATVIQNPTPSIGNDTLICGPSLALNSQIPAANSYQWYSLPGPVMIAGAVNQNYSATTAGTYMIEVDSTGNAGSTCFKYDTINIDLYDIANQTIDPDTFNICDSALITVNLLSSQGTVSYYLRDDFDSAYVEGPILGTGAGISIDAGMVDKPTTFNVNAHMGPGGALAFDGVNEYVDCGTDASLDLVNELTVEAWIKANTLIPTGIIVFNGGAFATDGYALLFDGLAGSAEIRMEFEGTTSSVTDNAYPGDLAWHHVAMTLSDIGGGNYQALMYIDGTVQVSGAIFNGTIGLNAGSMSIGGFSGGAHFDGTIDHVRIWDRALTASEIDSTKNACLTGNEPGLVAYYDFEENGGTLLNDITGNAGNNGTLTNMDPSMDWIDGSGVCGSCQQEMTQLVEVLQSPNPKPDLGVDDTVCFDFSFGSNSYFEESNILASGSGSYEWYLNGVQMFNDNDSLEFFNGGGGLEDTIILELDSAGNTCFKYDTLHVLILEEYNPLVFIDTLCEGDMAFYNIMGGMHDSYDWYLNGNLELTTNNNIYDTTISLNDTVVVVATGGFNHGVCPDVFRDTIVKGVHPPLNATLFFTGDSAICKGDSVELKATSTNSLASYDWLRGGVSLFGANENDTTNNFGDLGIYEVAVLDSNGCNDTTISRQVINARSLKVDLTVLLEGAFNGTEMLANLYTAPDSVPFTTFSVLENQFEHPLTRGGQGFGGAYGITMAAGDTIPDDGIDAAVDVVQLSYRSTPNGADLDTSYAWLMQDGTLRDFYVQDSTFGLACGLTAGNYHVVVRHRNHLTIMSNTALALSDVGVPANYNMSVVGNVYNAAYGLGVKDFSGVGTGPALMIGGNAEPFMQIDASDLNLIMQDNSGLIPGYLRTDFNLSGGAEATDLTGIEINNNLLLFSVTPNP